MNHVLKILAYGIGGFVLLVGTFVTISALTGTPLHEVKGVGKFFPEQVVVEEGTSTMLPDAEVEIENDTRSPRQLFDSAATPLNSFTLADPFSAEELSTLERTLQIKLDEVAERARDLDVRERELDADRQHLDDRYGELQSLRTALLEQGADNEAAGDEVDHDREVLEEDKMETYKQMSTIFVDTEAADAAALLSSVYGPEEAAKVLVHLEEERIRDIIAALQVKDKNEGIRYFQALHDFRNTGN